VVSSMDIKCAVVKGVLRTCCDVSCGLVWVAFFRVFRPVSAHATSVSAYFSIVLALSGTPASHLPPSFY
jgi:hypothetical protein